MAPVKVFGPAASTNVARVLVCLEEVGAEYELVDVDFPGKGHKRTEHLARNATQTMVPSCRRLGRSQPYKMGISSCSRRAIAKYVIRKFRSDEVDLLREGNLEEAAMVDVWTEVEAHQYHPALSPIVLECFIYPTLRGMSTNQKVVDESLEKAKKVLEIYEAHLCNHKFLAGDFISFADLNHFACTFYLMDATPYAPLFDSYPHVKAWWEDLMSRPSIRKLSTHMTTRV